ncbi:hypothetical protein BH24ACT24_BH24ACT24_05670 [soil metagenome]|nr:hypothetical protein [Actinomycetota bacterium]
MTRRDKRTGGHPASQRPPDREQEALTAGMSPAEVAKRRELRDGVQDAANNLKAAVTRTALGAALLLDGVDLTQAAEVNAQAADELSHGLEQFMKEMEGVRQHIWPDQGD